MTGKHFEALAAAIREVSDPDERTRVTRLVGKVCEDANPLFDWGRFVKACNASKVAP